MSLAKVARLSSICVVIIREDFLGKDICLPHPKRSHSFRSIFPLSHFLADTGVSVMHAAKVLLGGSFSWKRWTWTFLRKACSETTCHLLFWSNSFHVTLPVSCLFLSAPVGTNLSGCNYSLCRNAEVCWQLPSGQIKGPLERDF